MKKFMKENLMLIVWVMMIAIVIINLFLPIYSPTKNVSSKYDCNYKIAFKTKIVMDNGNEIRGEKFWTAKYSDPLKMYDKNGKEICAADDKFDFLTQNDHAITKDGECLYIMEGKFKILGDIYIIKDKDGNEVATAKFNWLDSKGEIRDVNDKLMAQYNSRLGRRDYVVTIFENNKMNEDAIQIIFASHASDSVADSN